MNQVLRSRYAWIFALLLLGVSTRFATYLIEDYPQNFTALGAVALFGAASFRTMKWGLLAPMFALLLSDVVYELVQPGYGFYGATQFVVYGAFALMAWVGRGLSSGSMDRRTPLHIGGRALMASSLFFVITNFSVWLTSGLYAKSFAGLMQCYWAALPFFRHQLLGTLFFTAVLFGLAAWIHNRITDLNPASARV